MADSQSLSVDSYDVICSGLNVVDILVDLPNSIKYGTKNACQRILIQGGAPAGNAACALAALGHRTAFLAYFGDNALSEIAQREFLRWNVVPDLFLFKEDAEPAIAVVQVDQHSERTVFYSLQNYHSVTPEDFPTEVLDQCRLLLVDSYEAQLNSYLLEEASKRNLPTVLDLEQTDPQLMRDMLALASHAILPLEAAQFLVNNQDVEDCIRAVAKLCKGQVVITDGPRGAWAFKDNQIFYQPAYPVKDVDTTGCGDAFHAAYASALLQGLDLPTRLAYASYFAAQVATVFGGRSFFPTRAQMEEFLKNKKGN